MRVLAVLALFVLVGVLAAVDRPAASDPASAAEYVTLDREARPLRDAFDAAAGRVRIIAYVAPTCGGCLRGADRLQKDVLDEIDDPDVSVFVVWVKKNGARERHVDRVTRLVTDSRATHYWDAYGAFLRAIDERLGLEERACAGAFLVYGPEASWKDTGPPEPVYWSDAHAREFRRHGPEFDPARLTEEVLRLLGPTAG